MEKEDKKAFSQLPKWLKVVVFISFAVYMWYFISTILLPLSAFLNLPDWIYITLYKMADFPISVLGFVLCISVLSSAIVFLEFPKQKSYIKLFLLEGITFTLYFLIPIISSLLIGLFIILNLIPGFPSQIAISEFLEDILFFNLLLFSMSAVLNFSIPLLIKKRKVFE